jgi:phage tail sheath protein FI
MKRGGLLVGKPEKAFFVRCDRSTMNQNDLDNGRLIFLVGVAALKPAEFVIVRIGQWTADRRP